MNVGIILYSRHNDKLNTICISIILESCIAVIKRNILTQLTKEVTHLVELPNLDEHTKFQEDTEIKIMYI